MSTALPSSQDFLHISPSAPRTEAEAEGLTTTSANSTAIAVREDTLSADADPTLIHHTLDETTLSLDDSQTFAQESLLGKGEEGLTMPPARANLEHELRFAGERSDDEDGHEDVLGLGGGDGGENVVVMDSLGSAEVRAPGGRKRSANAINLDAKLSPQPWDLVEPPADNLRTNDEYYRGKFSAMQSSPGLIPHSSYYFGPPPPDSAYGTAPVGQIGVHHPREILRVERDYTGGELIQFAPIYPLELEGRITPTQFLESINAINEQLITVHSLRWAFLDNVLAVISLQLSRLVISSHYEREMRRLQRIIGDLNAHVYNPAGLNILWPRKVAFLFMEIEYY
ncbi:unnamed protein product [Mycena citricolor]|uniref:Ras modification protein ERF4 n=1 Tax=Mycena citricolor TaxID=2018698 RepID=A0AAD2K5G8_9AGAR|nr:unnamed protein product [Mycena citricolor]